MLQTSNLAVLLIFPALSISAIHEVLGIKFKGAGQVFLSCKRPIKDILSLVRSKHSFNDLRFSWLGWIGFHVSCMAFFMVPRELDFGAFTFSTRHAFLE